MTLRKNRFYYYYRLVKWRILGDRSPIGASLKITQRCNLRCSHCRWEKKDGDELTAADWKRVIDSLYDDGVTVITVEGGEPTLHPDLHDIIEYIRDRGLYCIVITNGTRDISRLNPDVFWVSIDGMEDAHDSIRGSGAFRKMVGNLLNNNDRKILSLTSLSKSNLHDMEAICSYFSPLISGIMFNFTYPYKGIEEEALDREGRMKAAESLIELKGRYPRLINSYSYLRSVGNEKVLHPWLLTTVTSDGSHLQGCMVRHIEKEDCSKCDMGCCSELSMVYTLRRDSVRFWHENFGLPRLV